MHLIDNMLFLGHEQIKLRFLPFGRCLRSLLSEDIGILSLASAIFVLYE
jgi:hypothetical protein